MLNLHTSLGKMGKMFAFAGLTGAFVYQPFRPLVFQGQSMEPTYRSGEYAMTLPATSDPQKGEIVVVDMPDGPIVKRVGFVAGESIWQSRNSEGWNDIVEDVRPSKHLIRSGRYRRFTIPEGYVYLLGDNRIVSMDSRDFGPVPLDWVKRKVIAPRDFAPKQYTASR